jgi:hypothetical protein
MLCHFPRSNYFFAEQHADGKHCKYYYNASQQLVDGPDRLVGCIPQGHSETCSNFFHPEHGFQYVCVECYDNGEDLPKWTPRSPTKGSSQADITQHEQNSQSEYQRTQESGYQPSQPLSEYGTGVNLDSSMYTPIAPQPHEIPRSHGMKRSRDDNDESSDEMKRRKRSDSNILATFELSEEDKLLLQLKEEEAMPWKDIAQRFQSDLGQVLPDSRTPNASPASSRAHAGMDRYRCPSLEDGARLLGTEQVRHHCSKGKLHFTTILPHHLLTPSQMLEFGAQKKWTARQCAHKWSEVDPAPAPYAPFEHLQHSFAPYAMSPVEPPHPYLSYMNHVQ